MIFEDPVYVVSALRLNGIKVVPQLTISNNKTNKPLGMRSSIFRNYWLMKTRFFFIKFIDVHSSLPNWYIFGGQCVSSWNKFSAVFVERLLIFIAGPKLRNCKKHLQNVLFIPFHRLPRINIVFEISKKQVKFFSIFTF